MELIYKNRKAEAIYVASEIFYEIGNISRKEFQQIANDCLINKIVIDDNYFKNKKDDRIS